MDALLMVEIILWVVGPVVIFGAVGLMIWLGLKDKLRLGNALVIIIFGAILSPVIFSVAVKVKEFRLAGSVKNLLHNYNLEQERWHQHAKKGYIEAVNSGNVALRELAKKETETDDKGKLWIIDQATERITAELVQDRKLLGDADKRFKIAKRHRKEEDTWPTMEPANIENN